jgi:cation diffusion facilitator CzcD-associated flavoprotein CzcO
MREAAWDEDAQRWRIDTERGALTARFLVCAPGLLSEPKIPAIPGLDGFEGTTVHTARWGDGVDVRGKRVAVVGTGATAIQVVPYLQAEASQLTIFQRTPPWVLPLMDRPLSEPLKRAYRLFPPLQRLARGGVWVLREGLAVPMAKLPALSRVLRMVAAGQRYLQVRDRKLRRKLTPDYVPGCKRILLTNKWYRALTEPNVELVTEGLEEIRGNTLVGSGGFEGEADVIVFATGFSPTDPPIARKLRGSDGRTMAESWAGSPIAHLGSMVAGFPNLFLIYGPNTNLGHSSIVYMLETQQRYLLSALRTLERRGLGRVEVRTEAQESYNAEVQRGLATTVWNTGRCASWYLDANGENSIMWPDFTFRFRQKASTFDIGDHVVAPRREASATQLT